jgi:SAM-dependent methyltransferase
VQFARNPALKVLNLGQIKNAKTLKFFILSYYFLRSLVLRGPLRHFQLLLGEWYYERKFGIRTSGFKPSESDLHHHYQAASYIVLNRILKELVSITNGYAFYDIGCGKGRVLFMAARHGYQKLNGIELDESLIVDAKQNLNSLAVSDKAREVRLIQKNVLEYIFEDQKAVYFLFNPFNARVMDAFITSVMRSNKQVCYFVYMNPLFSNVFEEKQIETLKVIKSFLYTEAIIYRLPQRKEELK